MKKTNKICLSSMLLGCLICASFFLKAQSGGSGSDLAKFIQSYQQDASKLVSAYTQPVVKAVSYGMTGGWYHTGKTHSKFGIDLGVTVSTVFFPTTDNYFNPSGLGLSQYTTYNGNTTNPSLGANSAPTFPGPKDKTSYTTDIDGAGPIPGYTFDGPEGLDLKKSIGVSAAPVPMFQLGIGLFFNTDLKIRYVPHIKRGPSTFQMFGLGLMHDIKQHIPGMKLLPFDLSVLAAFNTVSGTTEMKASAGNADNRPASDDGLITYKLNSWVAQAIISKKVSVLTFYLGAGYGSVATNVDITGTFQPTQGGPSIKDPVSIVFKNNSPKLTVGMRLKFGPIYLVGDYTLQKYNALAIGFGVSIR